MQTLDGWYSFKSHTIYLEDDVMRNRILAIIDSTQDPFAIEIRYHHSCRMKYVTPKPCEQDSMIHVQGVR